MLAHVSNPTWASRGPPVGHTGAASRVPAPRPGQVAPSGVSLSPGGRCCTQTCSGGLQKESDGCSKKNWKVLALNSGLECRPQDSVSPSLSTDRSLPHRPDSETALLCAAARLAAPGSHHPQCLGPGRRGMLSSWTQRRPSVRLPCCDLPRLAPGPALAWEKCTEG